MQHPSSDTTPLNSKAIVDLTQLIDYNDPDQKVQTNYHLVVLSVFLVQNFNILLFLEH